MLVVHTKRLKKPFKIKDLIFCFVNLGSFVVVRSFVGLSCVVCTKKKGHFMGMGNIIC